MPNLINIARKGLKMPPSVKDLWKGFPGYDGTGIASATWSMTIDKEDNVYFGNGFGEIRKMSPKDVELWCFSESEAPIYEVELDAVGNIYSLNQDGIIYKISPQGTKIWEVAVTVEGTSCFGVDATGNVYYTDVDTKLHKLSTAGVELWELLDENVIKTDSIVVDTDGCVYYRGYDQCVYKISKDGLMLWKFGGETPRVNYIHALGADGYLYAKCYGGNDQYTSKISKDGKEIAQIKLDLNNFYTPIIDADGNIYATDYSCIYKYSPTGNKIWRFTDNRSMESIAVNSKEIVYCGSVDTGASKLKQNYGAVVLAETPSIVNTIYKTGSLIEEYSEMQPAIVWGYGQKSSIDAEIAIDPSGNVYFTAKEDGEYFLSKISPAGDGVWCFYGHTDTISAITADKFGNVYSASDGKTLRKISPYGVEIWNVSVQGGSIGFITTDSVGNIYYINNRVLHKISTDGVEVWSLSRETSSIAVDATGNIFCGSEGCIYKFSSDGVEISSFGGFTADVRVYAVDDLGNIYCVYSKRIHKISSAGTEIWESEIFPDSPNRIVLDSDGNSYFTISDIVYKISPLGVETWHFDIDNRNACIAVDHQGYVYVGAHDMIYKITNNKIIHKMAYYY